MSTIASCAARCRGPGKSTARTGSKGTGSAATTCTLKSGPACAHDDIANATNMVTLNSRRGCCDLLRRMVSSFIYNLNNETRFYCNSMQGVVKSVAFTANLESTTMNIRLTPSMLDAVTTHLKESPVRKPNILAYGAPGMGKTGFAKTMVELINRYDQRTNTFLSQTCAPVVSTTSIFTGLTSASGGYGNTCNQEVAWLKSTVALQYIQKNKVESLPLHHGTLWRS